jgi:hypothetical protein
MEHMLKKLKVALMILFFILPLFCSYAGMWDRDMGSPVPGPKLLYPVTGNIDSSGKDNLEFRWEQVNEVDTQFYDFRLYEGYNTTEENLVFKKEFSASDYPIKVAITMFEKNKIYTWTLIQVFRGGRKSDRSFSSFKIVK